MKRMSIVGIFSIAMMASVLMPLTVMGEQKSLKDQLVGTWIYVSSTAKRDDGSYEPRPSLQGAVTYTADGRFHFIATRTDAPKYASGVLARPSPDEAMAIASSALAYTGTYTVDEGTRTIHVNIETSTFPNLVGAPNQRRIVSSITADEMTFTNPRTSAGLTLEIAWKRAKQSLCRMRSLPRSGLVQNTFATLEHRPHKGQLGGPSVLGTAPVLSFLPWHSSAATSGTSAPELLARADHVIE